MPVSINVSTNSATIQNNIRLRIVLVLFLSIGIQSMRFSVSDSVQRAILLLEINYGLYGLLLLASIVPSKAAWYAAALVVLLATILDSFVLTLGMVSTMRCLNKSGCLTTVPGSVLVLAMVLLQCSIDLYQVWNIYLVVRLPLFVASSTQRMRILYAWAMPFAVVSNLTLFFDSEWTVVASPSIVAYPMLIFLAHSGENVFLILLSMVALLSNGFLILTVSQSFSRSCASSALHCCVCRFRVTEHHPSTMTERKRRYCQSPSPLCPESTRPMAKACEGDPLLRFENHPPRIRSSPDALDDIDYKHSPD
jgi:hypothetical protein